MREHTRLEIAVGLFVIAGLVGIGYLSFSIGGLQLVAPERYPLEARFASVGDLRAGAPVKLAGVSVGKVTRIGLKDYAADVGLAIDQDLKLPADTIASIRVEGLLGQTYISLSPGASEQDLKPGDRISQTESAINLIQLLGKYAFGDSGLGSGGSGTPAGQEKPGEL